MTCSFCSNEATTTVWQEAMSAGEYFEPCCQDCKDISDQYKKEEATV